MRRPFAIPILSSPRGRLYAFLKMWLSGKVIRRAHRSALVVLAKVGNDQCCSRYPEWVFVFSPKHVFQIE